MAQSIEHEALESAQTLVPAYHARWKFRAVPGWTILFSTVVGLFAFSWDVQWHTAVGRDRTLTPPHLFILGSIAVIGLTALATVFLETLWARRRPSITPDGADFTFAGIFSSSRGTYLIGYGALTSAIAFPLDQYWHTLYGIDVSIWAPFHIMLLSAFCVCCLGVADLLASAAHLAAQYGAKRAARVAYVGAIVAFATLMGMLSFLIAPSVDDLVSLGTLNISIYPLLFGLMGTFVLITAMHTVPGYGIATVVAVVYLLFALLNYLIIPSLMTILLGIEQQHLLPNAPTISVLVKEWQYTLLIAALFLDAVIWLARRHQWSARKIGRMTIIAALIGISLAVLCNPAFYSGNLFTNEIVTQSPTGSSPGEISSGPLPVKTSSDTMPPLSIGTILIIGGSFLLGLPGSYVGYLFGSSFGEPIRRSK
jgi:hypothetical protein